MVLWRANNLSLFGRLDDRDIYSREDHAVLLLPHFLLYCLSCSYGSHLLGQLRSVLWNFLLASVIHSSKISRRGKVEGCSVDLQHWENKSRRKSHWTDSPSLLVASRRYNTLTKTASSCLKSQRLPKCPQNTRMWRSVLPLVCSRKRKTAPMGT